VKQEWASKYLKITHKCINWNFGGGGGHSETDNAIVTPRPLIDGIMFLMACDDVFILKCDW